MELQPWSAHSKPTSDSESCPLSPEDGMPDALVSTFIPVECSDRWQMYFRLQDLEIPCQCQIYQPLRVDIQSVQSLVQVWSVAKRISTPRSDLAQWLNQCLRLPSPPLES